MPLRLQPGLEQIVLHAHPPQDRPVGLMDAQGVVRLGHHLAHLQPARAPHHDAAAAGVANSLGSRKAADMAQQAVTDEVKTHAE